MIKNFWSWFRAPSKTTGIGVLLVLGGVGGIIFWGGFNTFMEQTNTMKFCTGCHEMSTVYEEYTHSVHYENNSGVRAICSDCHVPKPWAQKLVRKIQASNEIYHKLLGSIDTPEKFKAKRMKLANNVWRSMKATDSRECRNCHAFETMTVDTQRSNARFWHPMAMDEGFTCIDCHKGIAHELPDLDGLVTAAADEFSQSLQSDSRTGNTLYVAMSTSLMADQAPGAEAVAEVRPGTRVEVLERSEKWFKVVIQAEEAQGDVSQLYADREKAAPVIVDASTVEYVDDATEDPTTRISWRTARASGWLNKDALASAISPAWDYAKVVYENECASCHAVFAPSHFKANEWVHSMRNMQRFTDLSESNHKLILSYLQNHAKPLKEF